MKPGSRIVFRTKDKGLCVGKVVWAREGKLRVRMWYAVARGMASWAPRSRVIDSEDVLGEATRRECSVGLAVDHLRILYPLP